MKYASYSPLIIADTTVSTLESSPIDISQILKISVQIVVGAGTTMDGTIQLQISNDEIPAGYLMLPAPINWSNLGSATALSAAATNYLIAQQDICYRALRVVFTGDPGNDASVSVKIMTLGV